MERLAGSIILLTGWRKSLLALAAGALTVLIQAPFDFPAIAFLTLPVLVLLLDGAVAVGKVSLLGRLKPAFAIGWWFGFGYFLAGLWWIGGALLVEANTYAWALPFAVVGLPLLLAFFYAFACALARVLWNDGIGRIFALGFGFGVAEWLREFVLTGFPWIPIGYGLMPTPLMMQSVEIVGTIGMNALAVFIFASPALLMSGRRSWIGPVLAVLLVAAHLGFGGWSLSRPTPSGSSPIAVRIVQPNIDLAEKWDDREQNFKTLLELSSAAPAQGVKPPELIVWPETSVPYILSEAPAALAAIGDMLKPGQILLAGSVRQEGAEADSARYYNAVLMIDDGGQIVDAVDKNHLVPFGEYLPLQAIFTRLGITQMISGPTNYEAGVTRHPLVVRGAKIVPFICYEVIFPQLMPRPGDAVNMVLNVTNDAWFGDTPGPYQHLRQAQLRAVETRKPVIRAANTGISAVINRFGQVSDALAINVQGVIDMQVQPAADTTPDWGDRRRNGLAILLTFGLLSVAFRLARKR